MDVIKNSHEFGELERLSISRAARKETAGDRQSIENSGDRSSAPGFRNLAFVPPIIRGRREQFALYDVRGIPQDFYRLLREFSTRPRRRADASLADLRSLAPVNVARARARALVKVD